jgi:AmmeMemoRadiSam system protein B
MPAQAMVDARKPAAAGVFYPAERELLARTVRELLDAAPPSRTTPRAARVRAIVVPHGILGTAGTVAAAAWARVVPHAARFRRVILAGPAHHTQFVGIAAPFADTFATPLGAVEVDRIAIEVLRRFPQLVVTDAPHEQEPSLEVQLPFLQTMLPNAVIVPLLVGEVEDADAAEVLGALWDDETLLVVSTDLSHYFDAVTAQRLDEATAKSVEALDALPIGEEQACGHAALRGLLTAARARKLKGTRLDVRHSGEISGELTEVVGYGAFVVG